MPGIIGCLISSGTRSEVQNARQTLKYASSYKDDPIFEDNYIICTRTHLNVIGEKNTPVEANGVFCWIEGEFYNITELKNTFGLVAETEGAILLEANERNLLKEVLNCIDGLFAAVIYHQKEARLSFITDRFGLKPLYIWKEKENVCSWSSELKGFLSFSGFTKIISKENILNFLQCDHYLENSTPFENVNLIGPSTILEINGKNREIIADRKYWSWSEIKPMDIPFDEAVPEFAKLLKEAVISRMKNTEQVCVSLSGGLDSRAILANAKLVNPHIKTVTFGIKNSYENDIVKRVVKAAQVENKLFPLSGTNWMNGRPEGIWKTDGMLNLIHMHASLHHKEISKIGLICLNGIGGGILLGGRMLRQGSSSIIHDLYGDLTKYIDLKNPFFHLGGKECQYLLNNRLRRFTEQGILEQKYIEYRQPFFHNGLITLLFSIPYEYRINSRLYNAALLETFPYLFDKIPYANTGFAISNKGKIRSKIYRKIKFLLYKYKLKQAYGITNYPKWISNSAPLISKILFSDKAIYKDYITDSKFAMPEPDNYILIGRLLTLEIFLQQVFNNRYFTTEELLESVA